MATCKGLDFHQTINGIKIQVVKPRIVEVKRTWKERLFSLKPFETHKYEYQEQMADGEILYTKHTWFMNEKTYDAFRRLNK